MIAPPLERIDTENPRWFLRGVVEEHLARYRFATKFARRLRVLDVACGTGYGSALLAATAASVVGVDVAADAIRAATGRYRAANLRFVRGDASALPLASDQYDLATSFETVEHLPQGRVDAYLDELRRVLVPGGRALISTPDRDSYSLGGPTGNPHHPFEFSRHEFVARLASRFDVVALYGQEFAPAWQLRLARAAARGPLFALVSRAWRAYKMVVATSGEVIRLGDVGRGAIPMILVAELVRKD